MSLTLSEPLLACSNDVCNGLNWSATAPWTLLYTQHMLRKAATTLKETGWRLAASGELTCSTKRSTTKRNE